MKGAPVPAAVAALLAGCGHAASQLSIVEVETFDAFCSGCGGTSRAQSRSLDAKVRKARLTPSISRFRRPARATGDQDECLPLISLPSQCLAAFVPRSEN